MLYEKARGRDTMVGDWFLKRRVVRENTDTHDHYIICLMMQELGLGAPICVIPGSFSVIPWQAQCLSCR